MKQKIDAGKIEYCRLVCHYCKILVQLTEIGVALNFIPLIDNIAAPLTLILTSVQNVIILVVCYSLTALTYKIMYA